MIIDDGYIRATALIGFQELVDEAGTDTSLAMLRDAGISDTAFADVDSLISYRKMGFLMEIAAQRLARPTLGLEWTLRTPAHFPNLGPLALLANFTTTLQEWIDTALVYWKFHTNAFTMQQLEDPANGLAVFRYRPDSVALPTRQLTEHVLGNVCSLTRQVTGFVELDPTVIRFQHSKPSDTSVHDRVFRCPIEFNAEHDEIVFDPRYLQYKTNGNMKLFKPLVGYYMRQRIQRLPIYDQTMTATIGAAIPSVIGTGRCNAEFISQSLGLTPKKLQRLLASEGTTFSEILESVRRDLAQCLLVKSDAPVARIAGLLDYSTTAPFTLAFKRWTGKSPIEYRKSERRSSDQDKI